MGVGHGAPHLTCGIYGRIGGSRQPRTLLTRYDRIREATRELLRSGETPTVEFKREVTRSLAKQAAAGANYLALASSTSCYTLLIGVDEETRDTGEQVGRPVGVFDSDGGPADLDSKCLQIEQTIRDNVTPPPDVEIDVEGAGGPTPILVVRVHPAGPPHHVDGRYLTRGSAGVVVMTRDQLAELFRRTRFASYLEEIETNDPLRNALKELEAGIENLTSQVLRIDEPTWSGLSEESARAQLLGAVEAVQDRLEDVASGIADASEGLWRVSEQLEAVAQNTSGATMESAWETVVTQREWFWHEINRHIAFDDLTAGEIQVVEAFFAEHLAYEPGVEDFAANKAETSGWTGRYGRRGWWEGLEGGEAAVVQAIQAVTLRAARRTIEQDIEGVELAGDATRRSTRRLVDSMRVGNERRLLGSLDEPEAALIELKDGDSNILVEGFQDVVDWRSEGLVLWRCDSGVVLFAVPEGSLVAAFYRPALPKDDDRTRRRSLRRRLQRVADSDAARLAVVIGQGRVFPATT